MGGSPVSDAVCDCGPECLFGWSASEAPIDWIDAATQADGCVGVEERVIAVDQHGGRPSELQRFGSLRQIDIDHLDRSIPACLIEQGVKQHLSGVVVGASVEVEQRYMHEPDPIAG